MTELRKDLPTGMPASIAKLPVDHRGFPVPWFVAWVDRCGNCKKMLALQGVDRRDGERVWVRAEGVETCTCEKPEPERVPEFRAMDPVKLLAAINEFRCWVCGDKLEALFAFVIGPMCAVNRISAEPPSHPACAHWSAQACPFLSRPHMKRREGGMPEESGGAGVMIKRNLGVTLVWLTKGYTLLSEANGYLFNVGEPREIVCYAEGRLARQEEIDESVRTGLPILRDIAKQQGKLALHQLDAQLQVARRLLRVAA